MLIAISFYITSTLINNNLYSECYGVEFTRLSEMCVNMEDKIPYISLKHLLVKGYGVELSDMWNIRCGIREVSLY